MRAAVTVRDVSKVFTLTEGGGGSVSLIDALRKGRQFVRTRHVRALESISFSVEEGERVGIIGDNGAGKTTLLSILAGLSEPTSGEVQVSGDVHAMLSIGTVLRDDLTGRENIHLDASVHGRNREDVDAVIERIIEFADLGEFVERPVRTYSSGMKARLAFSMGAFIDPDILILDETLAVGDVFFAEKALRRMKEVAASGRIVIMVTHSLGAVVEMCTRCLWLDHGRLMMDGDPKAVTEAYQEAIHQASENELMRKFGGAGRSRQIDAAVSLETLTLLQDGEIRNATVAAMIPLSIVIKGQVREQAISDALDLTLSLLRVDGRLVWKQSLSGVDRRLPATGSFAIQVAMNPFVLGADLYRLDVTARHGMHDCDNLTRVFEVVDREGQHGGKPLLYYPPQIATRSIGAKSS